MMLKATFFSVLFFGVFLPVISQANVVDRSVAIVNEDTITLTEVNELGKPFFQKITEETPADRLPEVLNQARKTVIDKMIDKKLVVQEAKRLNLKVSDEEVDSALQRIIANNKTTMEQFKKDIAAAGINEKQYREDLREQVLSSKLINHEVRSKVVITEESIIDYYDTHYTEQTGAGDYSILQYGAVWGRPDRDGHILTQDEARAKAEKVYSLARKGEDFKTLAKQYSDLSTAAEGGDLGTFQLDEMAEYMRNAVSKLKPGSISEIVEHEGTFTVFKLVSSQAGKIVAKVPYESVKEEIREKLYQQQMEQQFTQWLKNIREKAYIKIL